MGNQYMRRQPTIFWVLAPIVGLLLFCIVDEFSLSYGRYLPYGAFDIMMGIRNVLLVLFGVCTIGSVIVFIVDVWSNEELSDGGKVGWILLLILGSILIFPIYYHCFLRDRYSMTPEKTRKEILILTLIAIGMMGVYIVWLFSSLLLLIYEYDFLWIVHYVWEIFTILMNIFVILVYIFLICNNKSIGIVKRILWIVGVAILGIVFWPFYLWLHMFKGQNYQYIEDAKMDGNAFLIQKAAHEVLRIDSTYVVWFWNENESSVAKQPINNLKIYSADYQELWSISEFFGNDEMCTGLHKVDNHRIYFFTFSGIGVTLNIKDENINCVEKKLVK